MSWEEGAAVNHNCVCSVLIRSSIEGSYYPKLLKCGKRPFWGDFFAPPCPHTFLAV